MAEPTAHDLDAFDRAILAILQQDNTTPQRVIGERVNLSAPAVQRRIRRMEALIGNPPSRHDGTYCRRDDSLKNNRGNPAGLAFPGCRNIG